MKSLFLKILCALCVIGILSGILVSAYAEQSESKSQHIIISKVYGGNTDGYADHSFIELFNPTDMDVDLKNYSVQYKSAKSGKHNDKWYTVNLNGSIKSKGFYLIRCAENTTGTLRIPSGDTEWDIPLYNKGVSVAIVKDKNPLGNDFYGSISAKEKERYKVIDLVGVQGNDADFDQIPPAYEKAYRPIQSKRRIIVRTGLRDADNNKTDLYSVDCNAESAKKYLPQNSK